LTANSQKQTITLIDFIDKYHNIFAVIGVMGGLAALFTRLPGAEYLSILSFAIMLILDVQLWWKFPRNENASKSVTIFEMFFQLFMAAIGYYIVTSYWAFIRPYLVFILSISLFGLFCWISVSVIRKVKINFVIRELTGEGKIKNSILRSIVASSLIGGLFIVALLLSLFILSLAGLTPLK
jgi:hypothetical protein